MGGQGKAVGTGADYCNIRRGVSGEMVHKTI